MSSTSVGGCLDWAALVVHMQQEDVRPARFDELLFHKVQQAVQNEVLVATVIKLAPLVGRHRLGGHERTTPLALARRLD